MNDNEVEKEKKEISVTVDVHVEAGDDVDDKAILGLTIIALAKTLVETAKQTTADMYDIMEFIEQVWDVQDADDEDEVPAE
jgi:hypothetical protein